jgi:hypothetical protein
LPPPASKASFKRKLSAQGPPQIAVRVRMQRSFGKLSRTYSQKSVSAGDSPA